ncbi:MAG: amidase [Chloroflexi bacterium]|nr:MAG: amidase [Chloroflexota bacterium]
MGEITDSELSRRDVLKLGAGAVAGAAALSVVRSLPAAAAPTNLNEMTVAQMQASMASHQLSSLDLVNYYLTRIKTIDQAGPTVNSVIEVNPDATAPAAHDSAVAANLRAAGAVILGKTTLSEWANFRSFFSTSGWSGRGGQCNNPYALDRNACGSSSGSGAASSANFTAVSIGSETDGSIVCPASMNGVVGIKPTVGLTSRGGVVPISHTQDTVGPHCRTVADAAAVLSAIAQRTPDPRDPATSANRDKIPADYTTFLNPHGLNGARIGVARDFEGFSPHADAVFEDSLTAMSNAGATLVDVFFPHISDINSGIAEFTVLLFDFKGDLQKYFATRTGVPLAGGTLQTAIDFDNANAAKEMPFFAQEIFDLAETFDITSTSVVQPLGMSYDQAIAFDKLIGATEGIDKLLTDNNLDAIVAPTDSPAFPTDLINADHFIFGSSSPAAIVGYPIINVPMGMTFGVPVGISFMGTAFSEPKLITLASGFEAVTHARRQPTFLATLPFNTKGEPTRVKQRRVMPGRVAPSHI